MKNQKAVEISSKIAAVLVLGVAIFIFWMPRSHADEASLLEKLSRKNGCMACHTAKGNGMMPGPSWERIAARYKSDPDMRQHLIQSVAHGSKDAWKDQTGGIPMPPMSPQVSMDDIDQIVDFILTPQETARQ